VQRFFVWRLVGCKATPVEQVGCKASLACISATMASSRARSPASRSPCAPCALASRACAASSSAWSAATRSCAPPNPPAHVSTSARPLDRWISAARRRLRARARSGGLRTKRARVRGSGRGGAPRTRRAPCCNAPRPRPRPRPAPLAPGRPAAGGAPLLVKSLTPRKVTHLHGRRLPHCPGSGLEGEWGGSDSTLCEVTRPHGREEPLGGGRSDGRTGEKAGGWGGGAPRSARTRRQPSA
jgi:hypothetical protein